MKIVLAGAYGNLGEDILKALVREGHEVVAADFIDREIEGLDPSNYQYKKLDVTKPETLKGICEGAQIVISTVGLTKGSDKVSNYDIDYQGNLNLLNEAKTAGVKKFIYISVLKADQAPKVPMLHAKYLMEEEIKKSGLSYVIYRPTGYFYDIVKVFRPMIEKGKVSLLGKKPVHANVVDTPDFADFIVSHLEEDQITYDIGGKETYSYEEIAKMCFDAAHKEPVISHAPAFLFDILAALPKNKKSGAWALIRFSKWTLTEEMVADTKVGEHSFKKYIYDQFK